MTDKAMGGRAVTGDFVDLDGERFYVIRNVDGMKPFFITVVSHDDHWLFASSTGGLTAGRVSPETALFPYVTVDKIHDSYGNTGTKTIVRVHAEGGLQYWEPFNSEQYDRHAVTRNVYKSVTGNKLRFEEINHDLELTFCYTWAPSAEFGFVRSCELQNRGRRDLAIDLLDGLQNVLPAGTSLRLQTNASYLVDAYKWAELDTTNGLALFSLYSGISDRAEPCESLHATTVFCLGLDGVRVLLSSQQVKSFRHDKPVTQETHKRGVRGAYLVSHSLKLVAKSSQSWQIIADVEQSQARVVELRRRLEDLSEVKESVARSIDFGSDRLARIVALSDGLQVTAEEVVSVHHHAAALFNVLRGGIFDDQYTVTARDFAAALRHFNKKVYERHRDFIQELPEQLSLIAMRPIVETRGDSQLERLFIEYLPLTFGRRHGDPSRPWNQFEIKLRDDAGRRLISYQGNWRDIFQNWEALALSYPAFLEGMIAKFVNASTVDGYNPYRVNQDGFDWEVEDPADAWSYIGYWGDHQIVYLQKLLELSEAFSPNRLGELLRRPIFCYANVPYRIKPFDDLLRDPKSTVLYDHKVADRIERQVATIGADGKLILDRDGEIYQVNLLEKLLVPLLCKLSNLVLEGGIWLNTQRPEWNDANNALVGYGLSVVTLCYMRRYVAFLQALLAGQTEPFPVSSEICEWLDDTSSALREIAGELDEGFVDDGLRYSALAMLGQAGSRYRERVYSQGGFSGQIPQPLAPVREMLDAALLVIDHSIEANRRENGLYESYNLLNLRQGSAGVGPLYPMLEGQVAALSAGTLTPSDAAAVIDALFKSDIYRPDQNTFMLYPDRQLPGFLEKNRIGDAQLEAVPLLQNMLQASDERLVLRDAKGDLRFNAELKSISSLREHLDELAIEYGADIEAARESIEMLYEQVFNHRAFTGRSGTMFGFEGLGSVYWHMVSKLLLAAQENFFWALEQGADDAVTRRLGQLYYRIREGLGFNKSPSEFGAFPTDPYSHTPKHAGARQPGMTGQVKEDVLCRFGELGIRVASGQVHIRPALLRQREFVAAERAFRYLDADERWQTVTVPPRGLAFTWCQVPVIYQLEARAEPGVNILWDDGVAQETGQLLLDSDAAKQLFCRSGRVRKISVTIRPETLFFD